LSNTPISTLDFSHEGCRTFKYMVHRYTLDRLTIPCVDNTNPNSVLEWLQPMGASVAPMISSMWLAVQDTRQIDSTLLEIAASPPSSRIPLPATSIPGNGVSSALCWIWPSYDSLLENCNYYTPRIRLRVQHHSAKGNGK
jgi:hypothetical protein